MQLSEYKPRPMLVTRVTPLMKPRFPVFDVHNHLGSEFGDGWEKRPVSELLDKMDEAGVQWLVDLDGGWGEHILHSHLDHIKSAAPARFFMYGGIKWDAWSEHGDRFGEWAASRLRAQAERGAQGLKIWKDFGLLVRDQRDELVRINDPRLDPVWQTAGELNLPVTIHIADPVAFFLPLDETNERWEELQAHPDWQFPSPPFPPFLQVVNDMLEMAARHPNTTFIGAHFGCFAEDLNWVAQALDRYPNFNLDISERIAELGRQPHSARKFFLKYADRIMFGLDDCHVNPELYRIYYRFLETDDEYFEYGIEPTPRQGRWRIHGLYLPNDVLEKVYYRNAERLILHKK